MSTIIAYKKSNNIVYYCKYHIVWCPKYRRKVLVDKVAVRLENRICETAAEKQVEIIEMEIMDDHVHLLCEIHPQISVPIIRTIGERTKFQTIATGG